MKKRLKIPDLPLAMPNEGIPLGRLDHLEGPCIYGLHSKSRLTGTTIEQWLKDHKDEDIVVQDAIDFSCEGGDWLQKLIDAGKAKVMTEEMGEASIKGIEKAMAEGCQVIVIDSCSTVQEKKHDPSNRDAQ